MPSSAARGERVERGRAHHRHELAAAHASALAALTPAVAQPRRRRFCTASIPSRGRRRRRRRRSGRRLAAAREGVVLVGGARRREHRRERGDHPAQRRARRAHGAREDAEGHRRVDAAADADTAAVSPRSRSTRRQATFAASTRAASKRRSARRRGECAASSAQRHHHASTLACERDVGRQCGMGIGGSGTTRVDMPTSRSRSRAPSAWLLALAASCASARSPGWRSAAACSRAWRCPSCERRWRRRAHRGRALLFGAPPSLVNALAGALVAARSLRAAGVRLAGAAAPRGGSAAR